MRNILALVAIFQFLSFIATGQDIDKIRKDFEDKLRIRLFNMDIISQKANFMIYEALKCMQKSMDKVRHY